MSIVSKPIKVVVVAVIIVGIVFGKEKSVQQFSDPK